MLKMWNSFWTLISSFFLSPYSSFIMLRFKFVPTLIMIMILNFVWSKKMILNRKLVRILKYIFKLGIKFDYCRIYIHLCSRISCILCWVLFCILLSCFCRASGLIWNPAYNWQCYQCELPYSNVGNHTNPIPVKEAARTGLEPVTSGN